MPAPADKKVSTFWQLPISTVLELFAAGPEGLSSTEAALRLTRFGPNLIHGERKKALVLLLIASTLSAFTGDAMSFLIISIIVLISVPTVARDQIARHKMRDISRHHLRKRNFQKLAGAAPVRAPLPTGADVPQPGRPGIPGRKQYRAPWDIGGERHSQFRFIAYHGMRMVHPHLSRGDSQHPGGLSTQRLESHVDAKPHRFVERTRLRLSQRRGQVAGRQRCALGYPRLSESFEGEEVEDRAGRADNEHEVADEAHVPLPRMAQVIVIHPIQRDREFGYIVEEVVKQDLHR